MSIQVIFTSERAAAHYGGKIEYSTADAAAFDLRACIEAPMVILPSEQAMVPTGIKLNMQRRNAFGDRIAAIALPRSGRGSKEGLCLGNTAGLVDQDFQGEIMLCVWARPTSGHVNAGNHRIGGNPIHIEPGERIAQLMFVPVLRPSFEVVESFDQSTARGEGGFGSTGTTALPGSPAESVAYGLLHPMGSMGEEVEA